MSLIYLVQFTAKKLLNVPRSLTIVYDKKVVLKYSLENNKVKERSVETVSNCFINMDQKFFASNTKIVSSLTVCLK